MNAKQVTAKTVYKLTQQVAAAILTMFVLVALVGYLCPAPIGLEKFIALVALFTLYSIFRELLVSAHRLVRSLTTALDNLDPAITDLDTYIREHTCLACGQPCKCLICGQSRNSNQGFVCNDCIISPRATHVAGKQEGH